MGKTLSLWSLAWPIYRWFMPHWWSYLLTGCKGWTNFWCRVHGHPAGVWWYTASGFEPDMHCRNCEENLG
jgi:hypothetical protein